MLLKARNSIHEGRSKITLFDSHSSLEIKLVMAVAVFEVLAPLTTRNFFASTLNPAEGF
jgi:hypothetical protein